MIIKDIEKFKNLKIYDMLSILLLALIPYVVYLYDNYQQTGSILFPYYNEIFKSEYFGIYNWIEPRFKIDGIIQRIFWPVIASIFDLDYGQSPYNIRRDPIVATGYLFLIIHVCYCFVKKYKKNKLYSLSKIAIISTIAWVWFLKGYMRYGIFVHVLYVVLLLSWIINFYEKNKLKFGDNKIYSLYRKFIFVFFIFCISFVGVFAFLTLDINNQKYVFKDKRKDSYNIKIDGVWGTVSEGSVSENSAFSVLVREKGVPIYNLDKDSFKDSKKALEMYYDRVTNNDIYVLIDSYGGSISDNYMVKSLEKRNFEIESIINCYTADEIPYINANSVWYLVKVKFVGDIEL